MCMLASHEKMHMTVFWVRLDYLKDAEKKQKEKGKMARSGNSPNRLSRNLANEKQGIDANVSNVVTESSE